HRTQHMAARRYAVVLFLVFDPAVRLLGTNLSVYAASVSLLTAVLAFALAARRYAAGDPARLLVLGIAWSTAVPLLYVIAQHMVDARQLLFLSAALFLFTGSPPPQHLPGLPPAFA